jgi:hypothetical protein
MKRSTARLARVAAPAALAAGVASVSVVGLPTAAQAAPLCTGLGTSVTCFYTTVGQDTFTVPSGVTSLTITAQGGAGGNGFGSHPAWEGWGQK